MNNKVLNFIIGAKDRASSVFRKVSGSIGRLAKTAMRSFVAIAGSMAGLVVEGAKFNIEMARAWTMSSRGVSGFRALRREIIAMSGDLGVAKSELAGGLYQALSAGVPEDNVISFLRTASKVAVADGSNIATAVDGISTVLNAYGIDASRTEEVTDKLFQTVANGKTTFGALAASMAQAAPTAAALGVEIDQVLGAVATLTKQGVPTATAMVQIRNSMLILNKELGDGWSKTMTLQEGLQKVAERANFSGTALEASFGRENVSAVLALTGENAQQAASDLEAMEQSAGALGSAFEKVDQFRHWAKMFQTVRGIITELGIVLDQVLGPRIEKITEKLSEWRERIANGSSSAINLIKGLFDGTVKWVDILKGAGEVLELSLKYAVARGFNRITSKDFWAGLGELIIGSLGSVRAFWLRVFTAPISALNAGLAGLEIAWTKFNNKVAGTRVGRWAGFERRDERGYRELYKENQKILFGDSGQKAREMVASGLKRILKADSGLAGTTEITNRIGEIVSEAKEGLADLMQPSLLQDTFSGDNGKTHGGVGSGTSAPSDLTNSGDNGKTHGGVGSGTSAPSDLTNLRKSLESGLEVKIGRVDLGDIFDAARGQDYDAQRQIAENTRQMVNLSKQILDETKQGGIT